MEEGRLLVDNLHGPPFTTWNLGRRAENRNGHPALDKECSTAVRKIPLDLQGFGDEPEYVLRFLPEDTTTREHERSKMLPLLPALGGILAALLHLVRAQDALRILQSVRLQIEMNTANVQYGRHALFEEMLASDVTTLSVLSILVVVTSVGQSCKWRYHRLRRRVVQRISRHMRWVYSWFRPNMSLLRDALKDEDQLSNDVVVSMIEKPAGMAGEIVVATVGTAAAVANYRQVPEIEMISKGQADGPLRPSDLISEGVEREAMKFVRCLAYRLSF